MKFHTIIQNYKAGMHKYDSEQSSILRARLASIRTEAKEFLEKPCLEEFYDVVHALGRLVHFFTRLHWVSYLAWPAVKKHAQRFEEYGCVRSRRNCKRYCKHQ